MNPDEITLKFLIFLAEIRTMFRRIHLFAETSPMLKTVSTMVIPFKGNASEYADSGVTISLALNAEMLKPKDSEKKAIGMSLLLRHSRGSWVAEAEVGWSGEKIGWDPFDSKEAKAISIDEIMDEVPPLVEWMGTRFKEEIQKLSE